jgi:hypothetical protein
MPLKLDESATMLTTLNAEKTLFRTWRAIRTIEAAAERQ